MRAALVLILIFALATAIACDEKPSSEDSRRESVEFRAENFERATRRHPQPRQENFPMREALVKYTQRQDLLNHPWYIYVINEFQGSYQYFIGQTYPQSTCNFLGSTEEVKSRGDGTVVLTAPSLDGIFYGGGGSKGGGCDYFFFDMATDAMQVIHHDIRWFVSDRLLLLDARPVTVRP